MVEFESVTSFDAYPGVELVDSLDALERLNMRIVDQIDPDQREYFRANLRRIINNVKTQAGNITAGAVAPGLVAMMQDKLNAFLSPAELYTLLDVRSSPAFRDSDYARAVVNMSANINDPQPDFKTDVDKSVYVTLRRIAEMMELHGHTNRYLMINKNFFELHAIINEVFPVMFEQYQALTNQAIQTKNSLETLARSMAQKVVEIQRLNNTVAALKRELKNRIKR